MFNVRQVKYILDECLGDSTEHNNNEISYNCPFCSHYKKKLQINLLTQAYHCWVCNVKGRSIATLLKKNNANYETIKKVREIYNETNTTYALHKDNDATVTLPQDYRPLHINWNTPDYKNALFYVTQIRKLTPLDILRYEIGYCESGPYSGMVIIPSYDHNNILNYFVGRSYYTTATFKHKNPQVSKDIIGFENHINWNEPVTIVEGVFDAIAVKRNAIPLFGKNMLTNLRTKILTEKVPVLYIALDQDALKDVTKELEYFMNNGIDVRYVKLSDKDPSELGFHNTTEQINKTQQADLLDLIHLKLNFN